MIAKSGIITIIIALCYAQLEDAEKELQNLGQHFGNPDIVSKMNATEVNATLDHVQEVFKQKCLKNADEAAYNAANKAKDDLGKCILNIVNMEKLKKEIDEASPQGELDTVFKKYCQKSPIAKQCLKDFTISLEPCLAQKERDNMKIIHNITDSLADFICFKDGDRIALFIAENGQECLQDHQVDIQNCVNATYGGRVSTSDISLDNLPDLDFDEKSCSDMVTLERCVVKSLDHCQQPTPANIAEALFKFVRRVTPCNDFKTTAPEAQGDQLSPASSSTFKSATATLSLTTALLVLNRFL